MNQLLANGYTQVEPSLDARGVYWVAVDGKTLAVIPPNVNESCLASVEDEMVTLFGARGHGWRDTYVIWQPKDHSQTAWQRWSKKWSQRTATKTA